MDEPIVFACTHCKDQKLQGRLSGKTGTEARSQTCRLACGEASSLGRLFRFCHTGLAANEGDGRVGDGSSGTSTALSIRSCLQNIKPYVALDNYKLHGHVIPTRSGDVTYI